MRIVETMSTTKTPTDRFSYVGGLFSETATRDYFEAQYVDWDQRKVYVVFGAQPAGTIRNDHDGAFDWNLAIIEELFATVESIPSQAWSLELGEGFRLVSTDRLPPSGDFRCAPYHPHLSDSRMLSNARTVTRAHLVEDERLGWRVDKCHYITESMIRKDVIFKYDFIPTSLPNSWDEIHTHYQLSGHPLIVSFDRVVVDEVEGRIVGFTTEFIPGGALDSMVSPQFTLRHFQQLTDVIDDLNIGYRVQHCDVHPRNILLDLASDSIRLLDFNYAERIDVNPRSDRNDEAGVAFTLYELATHDYELRGRHAQYPSVQAILNKTDWPLHSESCIRGDIAGFRRHLDHWLRLRTEPEPQITTSYTKIQDLPPLPLAPRIPSYDETGSPTEPLHGWGIMEQLKDSAYLSNGDPLHGTLPCVQDS
ncbi:hypothetical protein BDZ85DRAFT_3544 [Elsinoe ampelina]|uniref:Protein kinase domain-containing protein n=1 Tax=Elsinoe ampelina TaxID=302913 RepID=A0A6A6GP95_9PEZI|nr:hypothetical protein BDZ85DRAFT_3544 [Elsinoe ampelina]